MDSLLKTIMESRRLSSSGGKYSEVRSRTSVVASGVTTPFESEAVGWARMSLPRLLVRQIMVFYGEQPESIVTGRG